MAEPATPVPAGSEPGTTTYQVYVCPYSGWYRRWRGRVITRDEHGVRDIWDWRSAREREQLIAGLWEDVHRDIAGQRGRASVELHEVTSGLI